MQLAPPALVASLLALAACGDDASPADTGGSDATTADTAAPDAATDATSEVTPDATATSDTTPADVPSDAAPDVDADLTAEALYDADRLHEVTIQLAPADWEALRFETRTVAQILGPGCLAGPPADVFSWFPADVTIDGVTVAQAGVRKKGFLGSLDANRPSLRIESDHFVDDVEFGEVEHVTLNNGRQDPSRLKQCLAYETFRAAGVAASRCSFAHVTVNGFDLGLYVLVEPVKKGFLRDNFGEAPPAPDRPEGLGQLWEGQLSDFRDGWLPTFDKKIDDAPASDAPLEAVITALEAGDDGLLAALDTALDLDQFITFWATEVLVSHWDGYAGNTNNFLVYHAADQRLRFIPWGVDGTFLDLTDRGAGPGTEPAALLAVGAVAHRLWAHPEGRARYLAELGRLLDEVWDEDALIARIRAWDALTKDAREPGSEADGTAAVGALEAHVLGRRAAITPELATPPAGPAALREALCAEPQGTVTGRLATTWGTIAVDNLFETGTGELDVTSDVLPLLTFGPVGAKAGENDEAPGRAELVLAAQVVGAGYVVVVMRTPLPLTVGARDLADPANEAYVYYLQPSEQLGEPPTVQLVGFLAAGTLTFEAASSEPGGAIEASFDTTLYML